MAGLFFLACYFTKLAYNGSIRKLGGEDPDDPDEFRLPAISYWQSVCLVILALLLVSSVNFNNTKIGSSGRRA